MGAALLPLAIGGAGIAGGQYMKQQAAKSQQDQLAELARMGKFDGNGATSVNPILGRASPQMANSPQERIGRMAQTNPMVAEILAKKNLETMMGGGGFSGTLSPGQTAFQGGRAVASLPAETKAPEFASGDYGEYQRLTQNGQFKGTYLQYQQAKSAATRAPEKPEAPKDPDFKNIYDAASGQLIGTFDTRRPDVIAGLNSGKYTFAEKRQDKPTQGENTYAYHATRIASALSDIQGVLSKNKDAATTLIPGDNALSKKLRGDDVNIVQSALPELGDALLTLGTGAAYTQIQFDNQWTANLPAVGDSDAVLSKKFGRIEALYERAKKNAGSQGVDLPSIQSIAALYKKSSPDAKKTPSQSMGGYGGTQSGWSFEPVGN